jgi:uncharacterized protein (TIGR02271 family)
MATRTITAMFNSRAEAERAIQALASQPGIDRDAVHLGSGSQANEQEGFLSSLKSLFVPDEDRSGYAEGMRRGGAVVTAQVEESRLDGAMDVLEQHGAVDLDEREAEWRKSGWTGSTAAGTAAAAGTVSDGNRTGVAAMPGTGAAAPDGAPGNPPGTMLSRGVDQVAGTNVSGAHPENETTGARTGVAGERAATTGDDYIPIAEERLTVGKREVRGGRVRVRSYVVETPVQEQVALRQENVDVERRTVNRPVTAADEALFQERTIEATESSEEAMVAKEARVKEELVVRKDAEERVQTVQDTVRRTEVEIEDDRTGRTDRAAGTTKATGPAAGTAPKPGPDRG